MKKAEADNLKAMSSLNADIQKLNEQVDSYKVQIGHQDKRLKEKEKKVQQ